MPTSLRELEARQLSAAAAIENADCRAGMTRLPDNTVSLVLTDPPYFIDGMDSNWDSRKLKRRVKPGVVGALPVGMKFLD